jgi:hypothetical protein
MGIAGVRRPRPPYFPVRAVVDPPGRPRRQAGLRYLPAPPRRPAAFVAPSRSPAHPRPLGGAPRGRLLPVWMREDRYVPIKIQIDST